MTEIQALNLHAQNLQDGSFNTSANQLTVHELQPLAHSLTHMSAQLRSERATLYQRELLLDTVLQSSPTALLLTDDKDTLLMSNPAARQLLNAGRPLNGSKLDTVSTRVPELATAINGQQQGLLHLSDNSIWHLSLSQFQLNQKLHHLYLLKPMTREIQREELTAWKKLLRVIGHELNNTLAPLSSLAYSGEQRARQLQQTELASLFSTLSERSLALNQFVQAYIQFAKLPRPSFSLVNWPRLVNQLQDLYEFELIGDLPQQDWRADNQQLQQLLLNLLKNAHESGSEADLISLTFSESPQQLIITLQDAGGGMSDEQLQHALVPFYTSKNGGSGIGLTLCRDIIEAHGGSISLRNNPPGLEVSLRLPLTGDV
ncbi:MAG: GHKL domain-containing protein [Gammaproteobacteria bacterium]|nr:GHKL domain-containing protein [Gammaproteobacteria bacterium]MBU1554433.1 GHKL domain-containing protein [Gammaproteobacteria bacterium]MBU2070217.1 GHKL domain-containing protein [Gammaproteobacteria bacterium]MBU2183532.1 GHKL domain-containing protein [Gammaproteobacteria bacterium]MBU2206634.1 GHKL domain-containing protein [Gammaproteobacteria bacterium]